MPNRVRGLHLGSLLPAGLAAVLLGSLLMAAMVPAAHAGTAASPAAAAVVCTSKADPALAARLARDIKAALRGRSSTVALWVDDPRYGLVCARIGASHFDSASTVKVTILGALLRKAQD